MVTSEYQPSDAERLFSEYYEKLIREAQYAHAHLILWQRLEECKADYPEELNQARYFFRFTIKSHLDDAILTLARILDKHDDSLSIWKFLNFVEQNREIFSAQAFQLHIVNNQYYDNLVESHVPISLEDIQEHRRELDNLKPVINKIKKWRDKRLAHTDRQHHIKGEKISIKREQLNNVIGIVAKVLNSYSNAYNASSYSLSFVGEDDYIGVLDAMRFQINEHKRQLEAMRNKASS